MTRKNIFTVKQTSQILNLSQSTVYRYLKQGKIKSFKSKGQYQISIEDIDKFSQKKNKKDNLNRSKQFISMKDLKKLYSYYQIKKLVLTNQLKKINNRYYQNLKFSNSSYQIYCNTPKIFYNVDVYIPNGVICLYHAAVFHKLIIYMPQTIHVAIKKNQKIYNLPTEPSMKVLYFSDKRYTLGIMKSKSQYGFYQIYDLEKTLCDFLAYRTKVINSIFNEIIKNYFKHPNKNLIKLMKYAKQLKVWNRLKPYLEILL